MSLARRILAFAALAWFAATAQAAGDEFPSRPLKIVAPDIPGGNFDLGARAVGASLASQLKQPVIVDNRPGGSTTVGAAAVARAPADGYTLLYTGSMHATVRQFVPGTGFDPLKDFIPISILATTPIVLAIPFNSIHRTIEEFVQYAKANPDRMTVGTVGLGSSSEMAIQDFMARTGVKLRSIPYKGAPGITTALLSGEIDVGVLSPLTSASMIDAGKLRALAISSSRRLATLPTVPTIGETVAPGYTFDVWFALLAPKGLSQPVIKRLYESVQSYSDEGETGKWLDRMGLQPVKLSYEQTVEYFSRDSERLVNLAKKMKPAQ